MSLPSRSLPLSARAPESSGDSEPLFCPLWSEEDGPDDLKGGQELPAEEVLFVCKASRRKGPGQLEPSSSVVSGNENCMEVLEITSTKKACYQSRPSFSRYLQMCGDI